MVKVPNFEFELFSVEGQAGGKIIVDRHRFDTRMLLLIFCVRVRNNINEQNGNAKGRRSHHKASKATRAQCAGR
jgi:hypothetical protein